MNKSKAALLTTIISALFFSVLLFIVRQRPGALPVMAYIFGTLGIIYFVQMLYRWIVYNPQQERRYLR